MNDLSVLNTEEVLLEMEKLMAELAEARASISELTADRDSLRDQLAHQDRQIRQLTDYAETLNRENSDEGVKHLKETVEELKKRLRIKEDDMRNQEAVLKKKELELSELRKKAALAEDERDKAVLREERTADLYRYTQRLLLDPSVTAQKKIYIEKESCKYCSRTAWDQFCREKEEWSEQRRRRLEKKRKLILLLAASYLLLFASSLLRSRIVAQDLTAAWHLVYALFPAGWFGWIKTILLVLMSLPASILLILLHTQTAWEGKDDLACVMLSTAVFVFADRIRMLTDVNLTWVLLLIPILYAAGKSAVSYLRNDAGGR